MFLVDHVKYKLKCLPNGDKLYVNFRRRNQENFAMSIKLKLILQIIKIFYYIFVCLSLIGRKKIFNWAKGEMWQNSLEATDLHNHLLKNKRNNLKKEIRLKHKLR